MTTRLSSLIDDIEACFDSLSLTTSGPDELRQKLAALRKAVALPADTAVAEIVERLWADAAHLRTRIAATLQTIATDCENAATALEAEHAARVKAEGERDEFRDLFTGLLGPTPLDESTASIVASVEHWINERFGGEASAEQITVLVLEALRRDRSPTGGREAGLEEAAQVAAAHDETGFIAEAIRALLPSEQKARS